MYWLVLNELCELNRIDGEILSIETITLWMQQFYIDRTKFFF